MIVRDLSLQKESTAYYAPLKSRCKSFLAHARVTACPSLTACLYRFLHFLDRRAAKIEASQPFLRKSAQTG